MPPAITSNGGYNWPVEIAGDLSSGSHRSLIKVCATALSMSMRFPFISGVLLALAIPIIF